MTRLIAFYLPQFHPVAENDKWWGRGFTEWRNVVKGRPNFEGHYQPHLPGELGFYDLRVPETREQQANLAGEYGIYGFCYYYYWFGGKRLLHVPLDSVLSSRRPNFPFCICWANENWTRRWDGLDQEILIAQQYSAEDDRNFIRHLFSAFRDERYIRVDGKPLLLVYRVNLFPHLKETVGMWRSECEKAGFGNIYLCAVQSFGITDAQADGFDAAVEFPPHGLTVGEITSRQKVMNPDFDGQVFDYEEVVTRAMTKHGPLPYKLFRTVMPSWDNTARRQDNPATFHNATPDLYQLWLSDVIHHTEITQQGDERLVFVNAWNEWAEGCHLEPDLRFRRAYLEATRNAVKASSLRATTKQRLPVKENSFIESLHRQHETHIKLLCDSHKGELARRDAELIRELMSLSGCRSWRWTRPIRNIAQRLRRLPIETEPVATNGLEASEQIARIRNSIWWEIMGPLRACLKILGTAKRHGERWRISHQ